MIERRDSGNYFLIKSILRNYVPRQKHPSNQNLFNNERTTHVRGTIGELYMTSSEEDALYIIWKLLTVNLVLTRVEQ